MRNVTGVITSPSRPQNILSTKLCVIELCNCDIISLMIWKACLGDGLLFVDQSNPYLLYGTMFMC